MKYLLLLAFIACAPQPKKVHPELLLLLQNQTEPELTLPQNSNYCARCYNDTQKPIVDGIGATK